MMPGSLNYLAKICVLLEAITRYATELIAMRFNFVYLNPRNSPARKGTNSGKSKRSQRSFVSY